MESFIGIVKVLSLVATGIFGAVGVVTEKRNKSGMMTKWGWVSLVGVLLSSVLSLALYGLEASHEKQKAIDAQRRAQGVEDSLQTILTQARTNLTDTEEVRRKMDFSLQQQKDSLATTQGIARDMSVTVKTQRMVLSKQAVLQAQVVRAYYPLEPLTIFYTQEYPMYQNALANYVKRMRADIVSYLRKVREGRKNTSDDLRDEDVLFVLTNVEDWKPREIPDEEQAVHALLGDGVRFTFTQETDKHTVVFESVLPTYQSALVNLTKLPLKQTVELAADFQRQVIIKTVRCDNPLRMGNDTLATSAMDLVGRELTWSPWAETHYEWKLKDFALAGC